LDGTKIVDNNADLWDGSLDSTINVTEAGKLGGHEVWTGTNITGDGDPTYELGATSGLTRVGRIVTNDGWIYGITPLNQYQDPVYALSGDLTVAPEPSSALLLATGLVLPLLLRMRRISAV